MSDDDKMNVVVIKLTKNQLSQLDELRSIVVDAADNNQRGMLVAQVWPDIKKEVVGFVPAEIAARLQRFVNPEAYQLGVQSGEISPALHRAIEASEAVFNETMHEALQ